jgi:hypothetical protein
MTWAPRYCWNLVDSNENDDVDDHDDDDDYSTQLRELAWYQIKKLIEKKTKKKQNFVFIFSSSLIHTHLTSTQYYWQNKTTTKKKWCKNVYKL